jgi:uncharacterized membrane protein
MQSLFDEVAAEEQKPTDKFQAVRVVLLLAAGLGLIIAPETPMIFVLLPAIVTALLFLAWILVMVWPRA